MFFPNYHSKKGFPSPQILDADFGKGDSLIIYDGADQSSPLLIDFGTSSPDSQYLTSTGPAVTVYFSSATFADVRGFLLAYHAGKYC